MKGMIEIGERWLSLAQIYGREISRPALSMMLKAVEDLPPEKVISALENWCATSKLSRPPFPVEICEMVYPSATSIDVGRETAMRIREAVTKFGWPAPTKAREFIGELGWTIVERFGGWMHICENLGTEIQETTFIAQCRDAIESHHRLGERGLLTPDGQVRIDKGNQAVLSRIGSMVKSIE